MNEKPRHDSTYEENEDGTYTVTCPQGDFTRDDAEDEEIAKAFVRAHMYGKHPNG